MTSWIDAVERAITEQQHLPYGRSGSGSNAVEGATDLIDWRGQKILRRGDHVSCVYTVYETFLTAAKILGVEADYTVDTIEELKKWCFVWGEEYRGGIGQGLAELGMGSLVDVGDAQPGDVAQIWDTVDGRIVFGHCVFIMGEEPGTPYPALTTYSAEPDEGNVKSWRYVTQPNTAKDRRWIVGRFDG